MITGTHVGSFLLEWARRGRGVLVERGVASPSLRLVVCHSASAITLDREDAIA
ncbi:hypothetical protein N177_3992 [Lutibaculum baratangense AMV1]|uniref:Uncharacterized protein n=1 Tax=Lutibaculum baratangense AMV1 TaxID=631454 RepID=V4RHW2_9HYPH|nr:hypothetical protein N177_3992 [Lutibaculum baratangense AMV1]